MDLEEKTLVGLPIFPGRVFGHARLDVPLSLPAPIDSGAATSAEEEIGRLREAVGEVREHIAEHVRSFHAPADDDLQQVLAAHILILEDEIFLGQVFEHIERDRVRAEVAVETSFCAAADRLAASSDDYLRARSEDLRDICLSIRDALVRPGAGVDESSEKPTIVVATHFHPSAVLRARRTGAVGFVTSSRSYTAHAALLLRAIGLPSLGGVDLSGDPIHDGLPLLLDADEGRLTLDPTARSRKQISREPKIDPVASAPVLPALPATTEDGVEVRLWANVDHLSQVPSVFEHRLDGIGLFRTEFMAIAQGHELDDEEQLAVYRSLVEALEGRPLYLRTFDLGSDKVIPGLDATSEENPALGMRGIRRHLHDRAAELRDQLRAVLRAAHGAEVGVMIPMVTTVQDILEVREHLRSVQAELKAEGLPQGARVRFGAMVEVPAAALAVAEILAQVDFIAVGTNDLSQYLAATDRSSSRLRPYLDPESSGLYRMMAIIAEEAGRLGRLEDVLVGGELASDAEAAARFTELGIRNLIVVPRAARQIRAALATTRATK